MGLFNVSFPDLIKQLLPVRLRNAKLTRWLQCLIAPVIELYFLFTINRNENLYYLSHNGQVSYLQAVLNDTFDFTGRGIYIADPAICDAVFIWLVAEGETVWLGLTSEIGTTGYTNPLWLYLNTEVSAAATNFIVMIPSTISYDTYRMNALIDKYRLVSKNNYLLLSY